MFRTCVLVLAFLPRLALACETPVCAVDPETLRFTRTIDFDDVTSSIGIGSRIDSILIRDGARFGERFAGQHKTARGDYDRISGTPFNPLAVIDGGPGETLGAMHLSGTIVLHGHGPRRYPRVEAVGEGSIAILFDRDQPALSFDIRGGEAGRADIVFLRRDGSLIDSHSIGPLGEKGYAFHRNDHSPDIAGILLLNTDPQGIAIDNLRFESRDVIG